MRTLLLMEDLTEPVSKFLPGHEDQVIEVEGRLLSSRTGVNVLRVHDIIPYEKLYALNQEAKRIAALWYLDGGTDLSYWDGLGVSVGECLRVTFGILISRFLRHVMVLQALSEDPRDPHVLVWGKVSSYVLEFIQDSSISITVLPRKMIDFSEYKKKVLSKARNLQFFLGRKGKHKISKAIDKNLSGGPPRYDKGLRIFLLPDVVTGVFSNMLAKHIGAVIFDTINVDERKVKERQTFHKKVIQDLHHRAEQIVESSDYQNLCGTVGYWFIRAMNSLVLGNLPKLGAEIVTESARFSRFLSEHHINLLLMCMAWTYLRRAFVQVAQNLGVRVVVIQDGLLVDLSKISLPPVVTDYAVVLGESGRRWFEESGISSDQVLTAGSLLWNWSENEILTQRRGNRSDNSIPTKVLYLAPRVDNTGAEHSTFEAYEQIEIVCDSVASYPNIELSVRFHPRWNRYPGTDKRRKLERRIRRICKKKVVILDDQKPLISQIGNADLVICYPSTTAIHAAYLHRPVIVVEFSNRGSDYNFRLPFIRRPDDLLSELDRLLQQGGKSVDRWTRILEEHISENCELSQITTFLKNVAASTHQNAQSTTTTRC